MSKDGYKIKIRAGIDSESERQEPFSYPLSILPRERNTFKKKKYYALLQETLSSAKSIARKTGQNFTLTLEVRLK